MIMIAALLLASARLWALLRVQASWSALLGRRWEWIAAALALALAGVAVTAGRISVAGELEPRAFVIALGFELLLGSVLGLAVALPGWALVGAAGESEHALALRGPTTLAPALIAASLAAALALGVHRPLLAGLLGSFDGFALAAPRLWLATAGDPAWLGERATMALGLALALATPVLLTRAVVELGVASLARSGPEARSWTAAIAPGLRLAAALLALGAGWSAYPDAFARGL